MAGDASANTSPKASPARRRRPVLDDNDEQQQPLLCRRCLTNLQIQSSLLAQHDPVTDGVAGEQQLRSSLDARYPILCPECRPAVEARIKVKDEEARREIWRGLMDERKGRRSRGAKMPRRDEEEDSGSLVAQGVAGAAWLQVVTGLGVAAAACSGAHTPHIPSATHLAAAAVLSHFVMTHLFVRPRIDAAQQRLADRDEILDAAEGTHHDEEAQASIRQAKSLRLLALLSWGHCIAVAAAHDGRWLAAWDSAQRQVVLRLICAAILLAQLYIVVRLLAARRRRQEPAKQGGQRLQSHASLDAASATPSSSAYDSFLSSISKETDHLLAPTTHAPPQPSFGSTASTRPQRAPLSQGVADEGGEEAMDWQPSQDDEIGVVAQTQEVDEGARRWGFGLGFGPQRFYAPEQLTGLEGLMQGGLSLETDSDARKTGSSMARRKAIGQGVMTKAALMHAAIGAAAGLLVVVVGMWVGTRGRDDGEGGWRRVYQAWIPVRQW